jgi:hypothetical protein
VVAAALEAGTEDRGRGKRAESAGCEGCMWQDKAIVTNAFAESVVAMCCCIYVVSPMAAVPSR